MIQSQRQVEGPWDRPRWRRKGFSLTELTVVVLILGIIAAAAQPRYAAALAAFRVEAAAERLASDLRFAAVRARVSSRPVIFRCFDDNANGFYRFDELSVPGRTEVHFDRLDPLTWYTVDLTLEPYSVSLGGTAVIEFDIYGKPDRAGLFTVSAGQSIRQVVLDADSGEVTLP